MILAVTFLFLLALGVLELWVHRRNLAHIPIRIHVNGTRGKSSVVRLIAAALRAGGIRTCAKTTGTLARMILPDGHEYPVFRPHRANVIEQVRIVATAAAYRADAVVLECMALIPHLQWLSQDKLVRATHGVITNARPDHLDVMGPSEVDVANALLGMTPYCQALYTAERDYVPVFEEACRDRGSRLVVVGQAEVATVRQEDMAGFPYVEHEENVALALKVVTDIGVPRDVALRGMWGATPDPGAMTDHTVEFFGRSVHFVNGFAANDPESTERIWEMALRRYPEVQRRVAVFNCRADRADRSRQLGEACAAWTRADAYVLIGTGTYIFARAAEHAGVDHSHLVFAEDVSVPEIFELIIAQAGRSALVMGMGNVAGQGLDLVQYFRNRAVLPSEDRGAGLREGAHG
ncbi:MAG: poly-gamma-glutamate synthase PgsB [Deltaproteobacteria bacterium]|nr:poly-gamma-glutamate synthase PgsB [Deltaproteobacteria bacterium]